MPAPFRGLMMKVAPRVLPNVFFETVSAPSGTRVFTKLHVAPAPETIVTVTELAWDGEWPLQLTAVGVHLPSSTCGADSVILYMPGASGMVAGFAATSTPAWVVVAVALDEVPPPEGVTV